MRTQLTAAAPVYQHTAVSGTAKHWCNEPGAVQKYKTQQHRRTKTNILTALAGKKIDA